MNILSGNPVARSLLLVAAAALAGIAFNFIGGIPLVAPPAVTPAESRGSELPGQEGVHLVGLAAARKFMDEARGSVVDARSPSEYAAGHLPGALNCHVYELEVYLPVLLSRTALDKPLLIYCSGADCEDSRFLAETLDELGYSRIYVYEGGFAQWSALGLPVEIGAGGVAGGTGRFTLKRALDFSRFIPGWLWHIGEVLLLAVGVFVLMLIANGQTESPALLWSCRLAGAIFVLAALHKIASPVQFARIVENYRLLPPAVVNLVAVILPWIELSAGLALLAGFWTKSASLVLSALTALFIMVITVNIARGIDFDCGCFGSAYVPPWRVLLRDVGIFFCCLGGAFLKNRTAHSRAGVVET